MANEFVVEINLAQPAIPISTQDRGDSDCFTLGDGHGSFIKVLHFLQMIRAIHIPARPTHNSGAESEKSAPPSTTTLRNTTRPATDIYERLYQLYQSSDEIYLHVMQSYLQKTMTPEYVETPADASTKERIFAEAMKQINPELRTKTEALIAEFDFLLEKIDVNPEVFARLIGDIFGDRGKCDLLTMKLLMHVWRKAHEKGMPCPFEILVSNHDLEFIKWCEDGCPPLQVNHLMPDLQQRPPPRYMLGVNHAPSLCSLRMLVDLGLVNRDEVLEFYHSVYKPNLRAFSCDFGTTPWNVEDPAQRAGIFSHAVSGTQHLEMAGEELGVPVDCTTPTAIASSIDAINSAFVRLQKIATQELLPPMEELEQYRERNPSAAKHFLTGISWSRAIPETEEQNKSEVELFSPFGCDVDQDLAKVVESDDDSGVAAKPKEAKLPATTAIYYVNGHNGGKLSHRKSSFYANRADIDCDVGRPGIDSGEMLVVGTKRRIPALTLSLESTEASQLDSRFRSFRRC